MAMLVCVRDERCLTLNSAIDTGDFLRTVDCSSMQLLRFIDRYGNTTFNRLQIDEFLHEWNELSRLARTPEEIKFVRDVVALAQECKREPHLYLWFVGDSRPVASTA